MGLVTLLFVAFWRGSPGLAQIEGPLLVFAIVATTAMVFAILSGRWN